MGFQNQAALADQRWQVEIAYQRLHTDDFYVGDERDDAAGPFGVPPNRVANLYNLSFTYGVSDRFSLQLNAPYAASSAKVHQGTPQSHQAHAFYSDGFGDLSLEGEYWLNDPTKPSLLAGSVALGVKSPTGSTSESGMLFSPGVGFENRPVDEALQLGDGGWGVLLRGQGSAQLGGPWFAYASGYYLVSLDEYYDVVQGGAFRAVPDVYSGRLGGAYRIPAYESLVVTLGAMMNGVTTKDLIGGGDLYFRRPGYEIYAEPGLVWVFKTHTFSVSYPLRVDQNKKDSLLDESLDRKIGADFAANLVRLSYSRRF